MEPKPQDGGRELNEISAPAVQSKRPIFFRRANSESPEPLGEPAEVRTSPWHHQPAKLFYQTLNPLNL
jgi:hypothetical protein